MGDGGVVVKGEMGGFKIILGPPKVGSTTASAILGELKRI